MAFDPNEDDGLPELNLDGPPPDLGARRQQIRQMVDERAAGEFRQAHPFTTSFDEPPPVPPSRYRQAEASVLEQDRADAMAQRAQEVARRRQETTDTEVYNSRAMAEYEGSGQLSYIDPLTKRRVPVLEPGTNRPLFKVGDKTVGRDRQGLPAIIQGDKYGQKQYRRPPLSASENPLEGMLYADVGDGESVPYMSVDEALKHPDIQVRRKGMVADVARKRAMATASEEELKNALAPYEGAVTAADVKIKNANARRKEIDQLINQSDESGRADDSLVNETTGTIFKSPTQRALLARKRSEQRQAQRTTLQSELDAIDESLGPKGVLSAEKTDAEAKHTDFKAKAILAMRGQQIAIVQTRMANGIGDPETNAKTLANLQASAKLISDGLEAHTPQAALVAAPASQPEASADAAPFTAAAQSAVSGIGAIAKGAEQAAYRMPPAADELGRVDPEMLAEYQRRTAQPAAKQMEDIQKGSAYQWGSAVQEAAKELYATSPESDKRFLTKLGHSAGGFLPLIASGPAAPVTMGLQATGDEMERIYADRVAKGATPEVAADFAMKRALASGTAQAALFEILPKPLRKAGSKIIDRLSKGVLSRFLAGRLAQGAEGAVLGGASAATSNVAADRPTLEDTGAGAEGLAVAQMLLPRGGGGRREPGNETPPATTAEPTEPIVPKPTDRDLGQIEGAPSVAARTAALDQLSPEEQAARLAEMEGEISGGAADIKVSPPPQEVTGAAAEGNEAGAASPDNISTEVVAGEGTGPRSNFTTTGLVFPTDKAAIENAEPHQIVRKTGDSYEIMEPTPAPKSDEAIDVATDQPKLGAAPEAEKNMPQWTREEMLRRGLDPARPLNDVDVAQPSVREAVQADSTMTEEQKARTLETGSPNEPVNLGPRDESISTGTGVPTAKEEAMLKEQRRLVEEHLKRQRTERATREGRDISAAGTPVSVEYFDTQTNKNKTSDGRIITQRTNKVTGESLVSVELPRGKRITVREEDITPKTEESQPPAENAPEPKRISEPQHPRTAPRSAVPADQGEVRQGEGEPAGGGNRAVWGEEAGGQGVVSEKGLNSLLSKFDSGEDLYTERDLRNDVADMVESGEAPKELQRAIDEYDRLREEDYNEFGARSGEEEVGADAFVKAVREAAGPTKEVAASTKEAKATVDVSPITKAATEKEALAIGGRMFIEASGREDMRAIQKAMQEYQAPAASPDPTPPAQMKPAGGKGELSIDFEAPSGDRHSVTVSEQKYADLSPAMKAEVDAGIKNGSKYGTSDFQDWLNIKSGKRKITVRRDTMGPNREAVERLSFETPADEMAQWVRRGDLYDVKLNKEATALRDKLATERAAKEKADAEQKEAQRKEDEAAHERYQSYIAEVRSVPLKGKSTEVSITRDKAEPEKVQAMVYGDWAIHKVQRGRETTYSVTHVPSGLKAQAKPTLAQAREVVQAFIHTGIDSANPKLSADKASMQRLAHAAMAINEQRAPVEFSDKAAAQPETKSIAAKLPEVSTPESVEGDKISKQWTAFGPESKSLGIPRAEMPQIKSEARGALVNFLKARDITAKPGMIMPTKLKPTQAEFSPEKVQMARGHEGSDRPILVSGDGHVVDGHHQWMAALDDPNTPMPVIQLNAPIEKVLAEMKEFPSTESAGGAKAVEPTKAPAATIPLSDRAIAALQKAKIGKPGRILSADPFTVAYDAAIDFAILAIRAGRAVGDVVKLATQRFMAKHPKATPEEVARVSAAIQEAVKVPPKAAAPEVTKAAPEAAKPAAPRSLLGNSEALDEIQRIFAPQTRGEGARTAAGAMREHGAELAQRTDRANEYLSEAGEILGKMPVEDRWGFVDSVESGAKQSNPELQPLADKMRAILDDRRKQVQDLGTGALDNFIEDYFPHIWKNPDKALTAFQEAAAKKPLEGSKSFLKQRTIPTTAEGRALGLEPVSSNPVDLVLLKLREMDKFITARRTLAELKDKGMVELVKAGETPPIGYKKIEDRIATVYGPRTGAVGLPEEAKEAGVKPGDVRVYGRRIMGEYYAPENVAQVINNYLSPGLRNSKIFRNYLGLANVVNSFQLGLSAFHLGFTSLDASTSKLAAGIEDAAAGKIGQAAKTIAGGPLAPITNALAGNKVLKEWTKPGSQGAEIAQIVDGLKAAGGRAKMDSFYQTQITKRMMDNFRDGSIWGKVKGLGGLPFAGLEQAARPIMEYIVPRQKLGVFADLARREMDKLGPDASRDEVRKAMGKAWDSVDNRLGQMVYDNLFWKKAAKDLSMASVRSLGWNLGTLRELGGGVVDTAKFARDAATKKNPEFTHRMAYALAMPMLAGLIGATTQYALTGKGPDELRDYFFPKTGEKDQQGRDIRISLPSYMKDVYHYAHAPVDTMLGKIHPAIALVRDMLTNKDYFDRPIRNEDDPIVKQAADVASHVAQQFAPIGVTQAIQAAQTDQKGGEVAANFAGVTRAPKWLSMSKAEQLAEKLNSAHLGSASVPTTGGQYLYEKKRDILGRLRNGTPSEKSAAETEIRLMVSRDEIPMATGQAMIKGSKQAYLLNQLTHLDANEAVRVFRAAEPAERNQIGQLVGHKIQRSRLSREDKMALMKEFFRLQTPMATAAK